MVEYTNRYGEVYTFTKQEDGSVLWEGPFSTIRFGENFIDPSGGPFISKDQLLSHILLSEEMNLIVESFERVESGYLIKTKPNQTSGALDHLAETKIIGGIINTTE